MIIPRHLLASAALAAACAAPLSAQFLPPDAPTSNTDTTPTPAPSIAPAGGGIDLAPPTTLTPPPPPSGGGVDITPIAPGSGGGVTFQPPAALEATPAPSGGLAPIRGDQALTASALVGNVKGQPVFVQDILAPLDQSLRRIAKNARTINDFRAESRRLIDAQLDSHIRDIFIIAEAERSLTERERGVIDALVNKEAMKLRSDHGGSIPAADRYLRTQGSSYQRRLADIRRALIVSMYRSKNITPRIVVTYQMVRASYERDPKAWQQEAEIELYRLRLPVLRWLPRAQTTDGTIGRVLPNPAPADVANAEAQALAAAREMAARLKALPLDKRGAEFARLVEDYGANDPNDDTVSRGGRTAGVKRGTFQKPLDEHIFNTPADTVAEPFLARDNDPLQSIVYVLMVGSKRDPRVVPFSEAEPKINMSLRESQALELWNEMTRRLVNPAEIEAVRRNQQVIVEAAVARYAMK